jgi:hypothetical protein
LRQAWLFANKNGRADPLPFSYKFQILFVPYLLLLLVDCFLEFGSGSEFRDLAGSDLNSGARLRVTSIPGFSLGYRECAETYQSYPITFPKGSSHAIHGCVNRHRSLRFTHFASARDLVNEIGFIHYGLSSQVSFVPSPHREAEAVALLGNLTARIFLSYGRMSTVKIRTGSLFRTWLARIGA